MSIFHDVTHGRTEAFLGLPVSTSSLDEMASELIDVCQASAIGVDVHLINAYNVSLSSSDKNYRRCLANAALLLADGRPLSVMSRRWGGSIHQVRGPDLFETIMDRGRHHGVRHYLLGSTDETLERLSEALKDKYPGVSITGSYSPPFRPMTSAELIEQDQRIRATKPDIVWVGLGTPKQDHEAQRLAASLGVMVIAVGAAFDFTAGTKPLCPEHLRRYGFEWMYRLLSEPRRLWKRYLVGNSVFIALILAETISKRLKSLIRTYGPLSLARPVDDACSGPGHGPRYFPEPVKQKSQEEHRQ